MGFGGAGEGSKINCVGICDGAPSTAHSSILFVGRMKFASLEANLGGGCWLGPFSLHVYIPFFFSLTFSLGGVLT